MMQGRIALSLAALVGLGLLAGVWIYGELAYPRSNPLPRHRGVIVSMQSDAILRRACFDCHSNETRFPWYSRLPITAILVGQDVAEGRQELNFSLWGRMRAEERAEHISECLEQISKDEMPPILYRWLHPETQLTARQVATMERDAVRRYRLRTPQGKNGDDDEHDERGEHGRRERD